MPDRDPYTFLQLLSTIPEPWRAAMAGFFVAILRIMYDGQEPRLVRRLLEATLCGSIALAVTYGAEAFGWPEGLGIFLGGAVGLFGADQVRAWGQHVATRYSEKDSNTNQQGRDDEER